MKSLPLWLNLVLLFLLSACTNKDAAETEDSWSARVARMHRAITEQHLGLQNGQLERVKDLPPLPEDRNLDYTFPDTLCGNLVGRLLECEIERIRRQPKMSENEKASVISYKRRTFARKRSQYLGHCEKTASKLQESDIRACMKMPCVEMDQCLQKISGQTGAK